MTFDILKRVMQDYFGYNILHVMNITDVEDKIILRARKNHLFDSYVVQNHSIESIMKDISDALLELEENLKTQTNADKVKMMQGIVFVYKHNHKHNHNYNYNHNFET